MAAEVVASSVAAVATAALAVVVTVAATAATAATVVVTAATVVVTVCRHNKAALGNLNLTDHVSQAAAATTTTSRAAATAVAVQTGAAEAETRATAQVAVTPAATMVTASLKSPFEELRGIQVIRGTSKSWIVELPRPVENLPAYNSVSLVSARRTQSSL